jgi:hypothetical protein
MDESSERAGLNKRRLKAKAKRSFAAIDAKHLQNPLFRKRQDARK